jgi:DNA-binding transcriptional LysR family regulator
MIEIRLLRNAIALAEYRNYARAAKALSISQPTLTRSIQLLEARLGCALFDRKSRVVLPTPVGKEMLKHARLVVASSLALKEGIRQFQGLEEGSLTIGVGPYAASILVGQTLGRFNKLHPGIRVTAMIDDWVNLPRRLKEREFDFVLMETSQLQTDHDLEIRPLLPHKGFLFCSGTHPVLKGKSFSLKNLTRYPFVLPTLPQRLLNTFGRMLQTAGDETVSTDHLSLIQSNDVSLIRNTVANSQAIGLATHGMIAEELKSKRFAALPLKIPELKTAYGIATRKGLSIPPAASALIEMLVEVNATQCVKDAQFVESLCQKPARKRLVSG